MEKDYIGWLSPAGRFYHCEDLGHIDKAYRIVEKMKYELITPDECPDSVLLRLGWVHCSWRNFLDHGYSFHWRETLTQEQRHFLKPLFEDPDIFIVRNTRMLWEYDNVEEYLNESKF